jgi:UDP-N-acetylmuramyl pentapeptide phosphotransferase/UDP-N-acetylglucosamine-1-phosphate transferase
LYLLDHPNERSLHTQPTPRTGGVAILAGIILAIPGMLFEGIAASPILWILAGAVLIGVISFIDDRRGLPVVIRFLGHVIGSSLVVFGADLTLLMSASEPITWWPAWTKLGLSVIFLVWMVNLYNFMDGMDGFAGGMAVIGFGTFAVFGLLAGSFLFAALSLIVAAAAGGFLLHNFPPARIFMGDVGSASLGLLAGGLSLWGAREGIFPLWTALLVFSPFIVDASVTVLRRLLQGERVWEAHRSHYYQRLVQSGWSHRKTVLYEYLLMLISAACALLIRNLNPTWQIAVVSLVCLAYILLMAGVHHKEKKQNHG